MAVTAGTYITEARILGRLAGAQEAASFSTTTVPTEDEVSRIIVEVEARVEALLVAAGFTVAITGGNAVIYVQILCTAIAAGRVVEAQIESRQADIGEDTFGARLKAEGWGMLWAVIGDPADPTMPGNTQILTEAGLTSTYANTQLFGSWELDNASETYATTPTYDHDTNF